MTEVRGIRYETETELEERTVLPGENLGSSLKNGAATDVSVPEDYENAYTVEVDGDTSWLWADLDITGYSQVKFRAYIDNGNVRIGVDANNIVAITWEWREFILTNNNDGTWTVTVANYGDTFTATASNVKDIFVWTLWGSGNIYATELRGVAKEAEPETTLWGTSLGSPIIGETSQEPAPEGYEGVNALSLASGDEAWKFTDMDISGYAQLKFKAKVSGVSSVQFGPDGGGRVGTAGDWREVILTQNDDGSWTVTLEGYGDNFTTAADVTNLRNVFVWINYGAGGTFYATEIRGVAKV